MFEETSVHNGPQGLGERGTVMRGQRRGVGANQTGLSGLIDRYWLPVGVILMAGVAFVDLATGNELSLSIFYLLPIAVVAWYGDRGLSVAACSVGAIVWVTVDLLAGQQYSSTLVLVWNTGIRFGFFVIVAALLGRLRTELLRVQDLAGLDYLTGAVGPGVFYELLQAEMNRCRRYGRPLTLAYIDLDDFKRVNDHLGHSTGDEVLRRVVSSAKARLRSTDALARLGGDEFVILLPETDLASAQQVLPEVQAQWCEVMQAHGWPVTFSIGAVAFSEPPSDLDEALRLTDALMYAAKSSGKNSIRYAAYPG